MVRGPWLGAAGQMLVGLRPQHGVWGRMTSSRAVAEPAQSSQTLPESGETLLRHLEISETRCLMGSGS